MSGFGAPVLADTAKVAPNSLALVLPSSIPSGSILVCAAAEATGVNTCTLSGLSGTVTVLSGPDRGGTVMSSYLWSVPVGPADSGATVTATWTGTGHQVFIGQVLSAAATPAATVLLVASSSGTMNTVSDQGGDTLEIAFASVVSGGTASTITLASPYTVARQTATTATSGTNISGAIGLATGGGGGAVTTSPASGRINGYTVSLASTRPLTPTRSRVAVVRSTTY